MVCTLRYGVGISHVTALLIFLVAFVPGDEIEIVEEFISTILNRRFVEPFSRLQPLISIPDFRRETIFDQANSKFCISRTRMPLRTSMLLNHSAVWRVAYFPSYSYAPCFVE